MSHPLVVHVETSGTTSQPTGDTVSLHDEDHVMSDAQSLVDVPSVVERLQATKKDLWDARASTLSGARTEYAALFANSPNKDRQSDLCDLKEKLANVAWPYGLSALSQELSKVGGLRTVEEKALKDAVSWYAHEDSALAGTLWGQLVGWFAGPHDAAFHRYRDYARSAKGRIEGKLTSLRMAQNCIQRLPALRPAEQEGMALDLLHEQQKEESDGEMDEDLQGLSDSEGGDPPERHSDYVYALQNDDWRLHVGRGPDDAWSSTSVRVGVRDLPGSEIHYPGLSHINNPDGDSSKDLLLDHEPVLSKAFQCDGSLMLASVSKSARELIREAVESRNSKSKEFAKWSSGFCHGVPPNGNNVNLAVNAAGDYDVAQTCEQNLEIMINDFGEALHDRCGTEKRQAFEHLEMVDRMGPSATDWIPLLKERLDLDSRAVDFSNYKDLLNAAVLESRLQQFGRGLPLWDSNTIPGELYPLQQIRSECNTLALRWRISKELQGQKLKDHKSRLLICEQQTVHRVKESLGDLQTIISEKESQLAANVHDWVEKVQQRQRISQDLSSLLKSDPYWSSIVDTIEMLQAQAISAVDKSDQSRRQERHFQRREDQMWTKTTSRNT